MKIKLSEIKEAEPKREHGKVEFSELKASIEKLGLIEPLVVNQENKLLCGRRRYQAVKELGWEDVDIRIIKTKNELEEFDIALDENIKRKQLTPLEEGQALLERKKIYERMYPETKQGAIPGNQEKGSVGGKTAKCAVLPDSFVTNTSQKLGISERGIRKNIQAAELVEEHPELASEKKVSRIIMKHEINKQKEKIKTLITPKGKFDVIVIDPPWESIYNPEGRRGGAKYPTMTIEQIKNIKLPMNDNCVIWLWVINRYIHEAFHILEKWELNYKNIFTWIKPQLGLGDWGRTQTEHILLATKGKPLTDFRNQKNIITADRKGHSEKPSEFYNMVEKTCYGKIKLDYFARKERKGWEVYGTF